MKTRAAFGWLICLIAMMLVSDTALFAAGRRPRAERLRERADQNSLNAGDHHFELRHGGLDRDYLLHVPAGFRLRGPMPLVLNLHGGGSSAWGHVDISGMNPDADRYGFIAAYPNGTGPLSEKRMRTWNAGDHCCGTAVRQNVDDVGFIRAVVKDIAEKYPVDLNRVYATGFSNGAFLAYRLVCEAPDLIAAAAPFAGHIDLASCALAQPVPVLDIKGKQDPCIRYDGGTCGGCLGKKQWSCPSAAENLNRIVQAYQCDAVPAQRQIAPNASETLYRGCRGGAEAGLVTIEDSGHQWPGGKKVLSEDRTGPHVDAPRINDIIWDFFSRHRKTGR